ncbi:cytochrome P450 4C1-like [Anopheles cruzii]|uniref:cytochrome P450 4C1-like n=1 Tax=Anopheles cruzii TaxID=68878 RepID=UPI0022EC35D7|nr:cytochrome P450 4C1-like [Anopheles cruzii]
MLVLVFVSVFALVYYINFRRSRKRLYELADRIPGPFDYPLIGGALIALGKGPVEMITYLMERMHDLPSPLRTWIGPFLVVVIDRPEMVQEVLNSPACSQKPYMYDFFRLSKGLFAAPADLWKAHRKRLNPSFSPASLKSFVPTFNATAERIARELSNRLSGESFDIHDLLARYTLIGIASTSVGVDLSHEKEEVLHEYTSNAIEMFTKCYERIYKPWLHLEFIYKLTPAYREEQARMAKFKQMSKQLIEKRSQATVANGQGSPEQDSPAMGTNDDGTAMAQGKNFIQRLEELRTDPQLDIDDDCFQQHIDTLIFAGNDTSAQTLANTFLTMGMFPAMQDKLYQEVMSVCPRGPVSYEDLSRLTYMEMFVKETLRHLPITGMIARAPTEEVQIQNITIPAGAMIMIPFLKMHHNKSVWGPAAETFDPDNFLPERCAERHPYAFIPFSQGPRNCIGVKFAWLSMKILLCHVLRDYRVSTDFRLKDLIVSPSLVMKLNKKHMVRLAPRRTSAVGQSVPNGCP